MSKTIAIGAQDFASLRENDCFYIDKTSFIKEWWDSGDCVTLITRPRRFGKTLNMSMLDYFFSNKHSDRGDLFEGLDIWRDDEYRTLQGSYPVIFLSFAGVKFTSFEETRKMLNTMMLSLYNQHREMFKSDIFSDGDREIFNRVSIDMADADSSNSLNHLCEWLYRYYGKKCIVLLDEYDTPMQEAYINGFWDEMTAYIRALFNNTFKTNPYLERAVLTGITRVSKESIFSDLNNMAVVTTTSNEYETAFGFTEEEVFKAMDEQGIDPAEKEKVKFWYDGFTFGRVSDIYNPWSVTMYLDKGKYDTYWANTSSNVGKLIREGEADVKVEFETLLSGGCIETEIDEQIVFNQLDEDENAIWSLLLASGYVRVAELLQDCSEDIPVYRLKLTNFEVKQMFEKMVRRWFSKNRGFTKFVSAMLRGDEREMNLYMNDVALATFSYFDTGKDPSRQKAPERFYHGFVLGLMVDRHKDYLLKSNRESGYGRYDVVMEPKSADSLSPAVIIEFKVQDTEYGEKSLEDTAMNALKQIEEKKYETDLLQKGISEENILKYGFAFQGQKCLIRKG